MTKLKILTLGAGAIGTYVGGSLALAGHQVVFVERPAVASDIRSRGLKLDLEGVVHPILEPVVVGSLEEGLALGEFDILLFALKSYHTPAFLESLQNIQSQLPAVLCLSNGVDNEPALEEVLGAEKVIAGTVTTAIGRLAAGDIVLERLRGIGVAGGHPLSERLVSALNQANLNARLYPRAGDMKWSKMLTNLLANASAAILDMTPGQIFNHPGLFHMEIEMLREALAVMRAQGLKVVDLPGTPVRALAFAVRYHPLAISRPLLAKAVGGGRGGKMPSFHIDLHSGSGQSEVDYLNGAVARAGDAHNVPTLVNAKLTQTLLALTSGELPIETYQHQADKFIL